jgi:PadR family transcriptional regulator PadR
MSVPQPWPPGAADTSMHRQPAWGIHPDDDRQRFVKKSIRVGDTRYCALDATLHCTLAYGRVDTTQLLKGVLDLAVLAVLKDGDGYGYDILRRLRAAGLEEVGDASVYGTLRRLFQAGLLTTYVVPSEEGPHRKYYALNGAGRDQLNRSGKVWRSFASTMDTLLDDRGMAA